MDPGADGNSKVAADEGGEPFEILDHDGLIEAQLLAYGLDHLIAGPFGADHGQGGVAGEHHAEGEGDEGDHEKGDQGLQEPADDESLHG